MANSDKNILITPNVGAATGTLPNIVYRGADNVPITMRVLDSGTLSFEGSAGQLFSIANGLTGSIFSVNDISGIPSIEVLDTGLVKLTQYNGQVVIGGSAAVSTAELTVYPSAAASLGLVIRGAASQSGNLQEWQSSAAAVLASVSSAGNITATSLTSTGALNLNYASPTIASNNASAASIFTGTVTGITIGSSSIRTTAFPSDGTVGGGATASSGAGFMGMPQNSTTTGAYRLVAGDAGKHIYSTATRTITIPGATTGGSPQVDFPIGTTIAFINATGVTLTLQMDGTSTDTCLLAGVGTSMTGGSGSRTLNPFGFATLVKITATSWIVSGNGLT